MEPWRTFNNYLQVFTFRPWFPGLFCLNWKSVRYFNNDMLTYKLLHTQVIGKIIWDRITKQWFCTPKTKFHLLVIIWIFFTLFRSHLLQFLRFLVIIFLKFMVLFHHLSRFSGFFPSLFKFSVLKPSFSYVRIFVYAFLEIWCLKTVRITNDAWKPSIKSYAL